MPYYDYICKDCGYEMELYFINNFPPYKYECPKCGAMAEKIFSPPVVIQKGYKESDARFNRGKGR